MAAIPASSEGLQPQLERPSTPFEQYLQRKQDVGGGGQSSRGAPGERAQLQAGSRPASPAPSQGRGPQRPGSAFALRVRDMLDDPGRPATGGKLGTHRSRPASAMSGYQPGRGALAGQAPAAAGSNRVQRPASACSSALSELAAAAAQLASAAGRLAQAQAEQPRPAAPSVKLAHQKAAAQTMLSAAPAPVVVPTQTGAQQAPHACQASTAQRAESGREQQAAPEEQQVYEHLARSAEGLAEAAAASLQLRQSAPAACAQTRPSTAAAASSASAGEQGGRHGSITRARAARVKAPKFPLLSPALLQHVLLSNAAMSARPATPQAAEARPATPNPITHQLADPVGSSAGRPATAEPGFEGQSKAGTPAPSRPGTAGTQHSAAHAAAGNAQPAGRPATAAPATAAAAQLGTDQAPGQAQSNTANGGDTAAWEAKLRERAHAVYWHAASRGIAGDCGRPATADMAADEAGARYNAALNALRERVRARGCTSLYTALQLRDISGTGKMGRAELAAALAEMNLGAELDASTLSQLLDAIDVAAGRQPDAGAPVDYCDFTKSLRMASIPYRQLPGTLRHRCLPNPDAPLGSPMLPEERPYGLMSDAARNLGKFDERVNKMYLALEETFATIDKDASGCISYAEFEAGMERLDQQQRLQLSTNEIKQMFRSADHNEDGSLDWREFIASFGQGTRFIPEFLKPKSLRCSQSGRPWVWVVPPTPKHHRKSAL